MFHGPFWCLESVGIYFVKGGAKQVAKQDIVYVCHHASESSADKRLQLSFGSKLSNFAAKTLDSMQELH